MNPSLIDLLNLELAWKRVKLDFSTKKVFVEFRNEVQILEKNLDSKVQQLTNDIISGNYHPKQSIICEIPKIGGSIRPAAYLELEDRIVYTACVGACYEKIYNFIDQEIGNIDFSNPIFPNPNKTEWISPSFSVWDNLRKKSLKLVDEFASFVVITDISACFENIDIKCLIDDLRQIGCNNEVLKLLSQCLNTWAKLEGRGIPRGYGASDILGKFYLSQVDKFLKDNYQHFRYVDDIRIFCSSKIEAKKSLMELVKYLGKRGLNIQTKKTGIYSSDKAKDIIENVQPIIREVLNKYQMDIIEEFGNPYINVFEFENITSETPEDIPIEVIKVAFDKYFVKENEDKFDKTLFHFLIKRFIKAKSTHAVKFCLYALENHPEETKKIFEYFKKIELFSSNELFPAIIQFLTNYLSSDRSIYQYQNYLIINFLIDVDFEPNASLLKIVRKIVFEEKSEMYLICAGLNFLGKYGNHIDFEKIELEFPNYHLKVQIEAIFTLVNMEKAKRNSFYSRISLNSNLHEKAVSLAKTRIIESAISI
jgi:hypothetical protein